MKSRFPVISDAIFGFSIEFWCDVIFPDFLEKFVGQKYSIYSEISPIHALHTHKFFEKIIKINIKSLLEQLES